MSIVFFFVVVVTLSGFGVGAILVSCNKSGILPSLYTLWTMLREALLVFLQRASRI